MNTRFRLLVPAVLAALCSPLAIAAATSNPESTSRSTAKPVPLADATIIVETNATDGDAGLQVFLDGEPWKSIAITDPNGRKILAINAKNRLKNFGLTELFSESSEPPFDEFPLEKFKALFPEGTYTFTGRTIDGEKLAGQATLTHDIPAGPEITAPVDGAVVAPGSVVASWNAVTEPAGIDIVAYRAIVTREDPLRVFSVDLPAAVTSVTIPAEFLEAGTENKLEVQAIEASGNQTLTEILFRVA